MSDAVGDDVDEGVDDFADWVSDDEGDEGVEDFADWASADEGDDSLGFRPSLGRSAGTASSLR